VHRVPHGIADEQAAPLLYAGIIGYRALRLVLCAPQAAPAALVIALFPGAASPFLSSNEVGGMYESQGQAKPVSGLTGLWYIPGMFILVGPIVWFVKTNGALNTYWRALGAR
jgi:hypothetical protein